MLEDNQINLSQIKKRLKSAVVNLTARQIALRAIAFISINVVLARVLPVETLGIFNIATAVVSFFAFFSDVGLAASLIQKKDSVTFDDIKTTFTIQQGLVAILSILIILSAPMLGSFYNLDNDGIWLIRILGFGFFLTSLKVIPSVMLERQLNFSPLVLVEVIETLIFNAVLIAMVFLDYGIWSFSVASLARGFIGVVMIYILAPVKIGLGIEAVAAKNLLSFGVPFQLNSILALLKDRLVPLVIARMIGTAGVGYVTWAQALALLPLEIMNVIIRVTFPAFSRLQHDKQNLSKLVNESLFITSLLVYPILFGIAAILPSMVAFVVSPKWQPAVQSFYFFAFSTYWAVISTTFTNTLNAIGSIKITLKLMIMWTALTWILTPILTYQYGFVGVGLASFLISFTSVLTIIAIKKVLVVNVLDGIFLPTAASMVMSMIVYFYSDRFVRNWWGIVIAAALGGAIYIGIIYFFGRKRLLKSLQVLKHE